MELMRNCSLVSGLSPASLEWRVEPRVSHLQDLLCALSLAILACTFLYWILVPINQIRDWSQASQDNHPRSRPVPPVFPNGWVPIAESRDITSARIFKAKVHVNQVIIVRKSDGSVAVYDAFCPHLGADLSVGGEIVKSSRGDSCIKCPFHGWLFSSSDGTCAEVAYAKDQSE